MTTFEYLIATLVISAILGVFLQPWRLVKIIAEDDGLFYKKRFGKGEDLIAYTSLSIIYKGSFNRLSLRPNLIPNADPSRVRIFQNYMLYSSVAIIKCTKNSLDLFFILYEDDEVKKCLEYIEEYRSD